MAVRVVNATASDWNDLSHHWPSVLANFGRLAKRFPADITVERLLADIGVGQDHARRVLWLILDDDKLVAVALTAVETLEATGVKVLRMMGLGGRDIPSWSGELIRTMEAYGDDQGVDYLAVEGRAGWSKVIEPMGFQKHSVLWRRKVA